MELNLFHYNGAINVCQKCSAWQLAMDLLDRMPRRSIQRLESISDFLPKFLVDQVVNKDVSPEISCHPPVSEA